MKAGYSELLSSLKTQIREARVRAALAVNRELVLLYWRIGRQILERQESEGWGTKVIDRLSTDLRAEFPEMRGMSSRNLKYMRSFAECWPEEEIVQQLVAQLPWGHSVRILDQAKSAEARVWYTRAAIEHGWSRNVLLLQIESGLFERQGRSCNNFSRALPEPQSDLARQILKDPYNFEFLALSKDAQERELEEGLLAQLRRFLLELGAGFAFVGSQYPLEVAGKDYRLDLLFYHLKLRAYVVIDLKCGEFKPEYSGKMNFYLSAVDDLLRHPDDKPSIGLILCKGKDAVTVEYALRNLSSPMSIAEFRCCLPTVEALQARLGSVS